MNITNDIELGSQNAFTKQSEPTDARYSMFNTGGVECEVGEFLYGLVQMMKPENVLETGTHRGVGASYIGSALKENGFGHLTTIEFIPELREESMFVIDSLGLSDVVSCILGNVTAWQTKDVFDLIFLDTEPNLRFNELLKFWDNLKPGGIVLIHDLGVGMGQTGITVNGQENWPFGTMPEDIKKLMFTHELQSLHFSTPRGLYIGQKRRDDFYSNKII